MDALSELSAITTQVGTVAHDILEEGMIVLESSKTDIVDRIVEDHSGYSEDDIAHGVSETVVSLLADAADADREIDTFAKFLAFSETVNESNVVDKCPFLASVWFGDEYGVEHVDGLKALLSDLNENMRLLTFDNIVDLSVDFLQKNPPAQEEPAPVSQLSVVVEDE